jgi:hypothetical protein
MNEHSPPDVAPSAFESLIEDAADQTGVPVPTIYRWARTGIIGQRRFPTRDSAGRMRHRIYVNTNEVQSVDESRRRVIPPQPRYEE